MTPMPDPLAVGPPVSPVSTGGAHPRSARRRWPLVPLLLALLALIDLRVEMQLLVDHLTWTSLAEAVRSHLLAVMVLLFTPSLLRHYR